MSGADRPIVQAVTFQCSSIGWKVTYRWSGGIVSYINNCQLLEMATIQGSLA